MSTLERAIVIAAEAHAGQVDKAGAPYILHPLRVMQRVHSDAARIAGVLHDVLEDTPWTLEALRAEGFSQEVLDALYAVTRQPAESYEEFVQRAGKHPVGRDVKLADLFDNADLSRIANPGEADLQRRLKYTRAIESLGGKLP